MNTNGNITKTVSEVYRLQFSSLLADSVIRFYINYSKNTFSDDYGLMALATIMTDVELFSETGLEQQ